MHAWINSSTKLRLAGERDKSEGDKEKTVPKRGEVCVVWSFFWFEKSMTWTRHLFNTNVVKLKLLPYGSTRDRVNCGFQHPASVVVAEVKTKAL